MGYAEATSVPVDRSIGEITRMLRTAGAERLATAEIPGQIAIQCMLHDRMLRFAVNMPDITEMPKRDGRGSTLSDSQRAAKVSQRHRQRARALLLVVKAKLESVESGVETFEEAFLANVVMPDGKTIAQHAAPAIESAYAGGPSIPLLPGY